MRLIDATEYAKELKNEMDWPGRHPEFVSAIECAMADLSDMPTIEARPVVHARWIKDEHTHWYRCSNCNRVRPYDTCDATDSNDPIHVYWDCNFCPECSATMDLESEDRDE